MGNASKKLVVVLSRNYATGLSVIRSLGSAGYTVDLVASAFRAGNSKIAAKSKYVRKSVEVTSRKVKDGGDYELVKELLKYADEKEFGKPVLFPTDDYTASVMDLNRDKLKDIFIMPEIVGGGKGAMTECMNKTFQGELARRVGILTPKEWIISLENEIVIPRDMIYPCFVKPIESVSGYKREMATCNNMRELENHLKKLQRRFANRSILVQEYLEIDNEIDFSGVCFDQEVIIPAIIKKTNVAQFEKGVTLSGKLVPFEEMGELTDKIIRMMQEFHYVGMFDFEFAIVGDKIYFNEVNLRSGGPNYAYFKSGVNLPALYVKEAFGEGHTPEDEKVEAYEKTFIYEKIAWEDHINGFMSRKELKACIEESDITLLCDDDDPVPGDIFTKSTKNQVRKKRVRDVESSINGVKSNVLGAIKKVLRAIWIFILGYPQTKRKNKRNPNSEMPRVLVSGRNYCSNLTMARSLGMAGYEVEVLRIFQKKPKRTNIMRQIQPEAHSKYIKGYYVCYSRREERRIVDHLIKLADPNRKMLLIPADDLVAFVADSYYDELSKYYLMPNINNTQDEIGRMMEKGVQKELAIKAGLPVVNSCVISASFGNFTIPDSVTYPCFIKPNVSKNSAKSRMKKCKNRAQLKKALKKFSRKKPIEMLVEDYVEIEREYSILGVSTKNGAIGPAFFSAEVGGKKEHRGVAVVGKTLPCSQEQELIDKITKFVSSLNFDGLYDVDLIQATDGKMYFVELNMRFGASGYAFTECGVNLPGMFADYMLKGKPIDLNTKVEETGKTFVSDKVLIDEFVGGRLALADFKKYQNSADIYFIKSDDDPKAFNHFKLFFAYAYFVAVVRKLRRIKNKIARANRRIKRKLRRIFITPVRKRFFKFPQWNPENERKINAELPRVVVSGRNYCSNLTLAKSLGMAGYEVEILKIFQVKPKKNDLMKQLHPDAFSKYVKSYQVCISKRKDKAIVKKLIKMADPYQKMLLIPADDLVAYIADRYYTKLSKYYYLPNIANMPRQIGRMMEKGVQKHLAKNAGLPVLNSCVINVKRRGPIEIPETVTYPCFIKPNVSKNSAKSRMKVCENEEDLVLTLREYSIKKEISFLVEDYVEIDKEYSILGVSTKDGVIGPGFFVAEQGGQNEHRGVAVVGRTLPCSDQPELINNILKFISTLDFDGLYDVDLIQTKDGKMYFVELNMRFGASGYAFTECGVNLPGMFADYMIKGTPIDLDVEVKKTGKTFVSEKVLIEEYVNSRLSKKMLNECMDNVDIHFIKNDDDPLPYEHFKKFHFIASLMRLALKYKNFVDRLA